MIETQESTIVATRLGKVRGTVAGGIHAFKGIPYAAPPFGANRLRAPQPAEPWTGVRDATREGAQPPQLFPPGNPADGLIPADRAAVGEDCLNLNIWTPDPAATGLPVLVWIPIGMFEVGSASWYDGSRFARDGVVCVAVNCRVGAEGFLHLDDTITNRGLLDQIAALEWVRDNIAAFGGDPANVTICGESAGAMGIGTLLAMPRADGLFRRAIMQSGAAHPVLPAAAARRIGGYLADKLGVAPNLAAMAGVSIDRMLEAQAALKADLMARPDPEQWGMGVVATALPFQPVIDGDVLPGEPVGRIQAGAGRGVDILVGSNLDDWRMFRVLSGELGKITDQVLTGPVAEHGYLAAAAYGLPLDTALPAYRAAYPAAGPGDLLIAIQTDWWCRIPGIRVAEAHLGGEGRTYMYEFAWPSPAAGGLLGACHALEIPFVFDTLDQGSRQMLGDLLGPNPPQELASTMHAAWVGFISRGEPGWPAYEPVRRATMRFGVPSQVVDDPRAWERRLWSVATQPAMTGEGART